MRKPSKKAQIKVIEAQLSELHRLRAERGIADGETALFNALTLSLIRLICGAQNPVDSLIR